MSSGSTRSAGLGVPRRKDRRAGPRRGLSRLDTGRGLRDRESSRISRAHASAASPRRRPAHELPCCTRGRNVDTGDAYSNTPHTPHSLLPAGIANAMFFAATLAARSEYAPVEARSQVFIWVGALKIAAGSAGTAAAGAAITQTVWAPLLLAIALTPAAATTSIIERSHQRRSKH